MGEVSNFSRVPCQHHNRRILFMAKKITAVVKLQLPAGKATPAPPVGSTLGPFGINLPGFTKEFNAKTADKAGLIIPVVVTIYQDRSFTFILKLPPRRFDQEGARTRDGKRETQFRQGGQAYQGSGRGNRKDENARPQLHLSRKRDEHDCGNRSQHGRHGGRVISRRTRQGEIPSSTARRI